MNDPCISRLRRPLHAGPPGKGRENFSARENSL